jgi:DNA-binding IclR family transcriptional regulator
VISAGEPIMRRLRDETGETVSLTALAGNYRIYVAEFPSMHPLRFVHEVGALAPVHAGASGRAVLSLLDAETRRSILSGTLAAYSDSTITDPDALEASIVGVQQQGYAVSYGERSAGAVGIAVPFRDPMTDAPYSLAIFMPVVRFDPSKVDGYVASLQAAVQEIAAAHVRH